EVDVLLILFSVINPQAYVAYDCGPRRIDFLLRNSKFLTQRSLKELYIPLYATTHSPRRTLPTGVINILKRWNIKELYADIECEVDNLRRHIKILESAKHEDIKCILVHGKLLVEP
ncbi:hypothetical protein BJ322DRAFT_1008706, partial [Thelephora terrestris]